MTPQDQDEIKPAVARYTEERVMRPVAVNADAVKRTVFVADDDGVARGLLRTLLIASGMRVVGEAIDGKQALSEIRRLKPDVVCLDIGMPVMNGLEVLAQLRGENDQLIALIITASPTAQNVREAIQARADGVIAKPFSQEKIYNEILRATSRRMLNR